MRQLLHCGHRLIAVRMLENNKEKEEHLCGQLKTHSYHEAGIEGILITCSSSTHERIKG